MGDAAIAAHISAVFNRTFAAWRTVLVGGGDEPLYTPARAGVPACIVFTRDYPSSALHEAAHWCVAGAARRRRVDYGYPYLAPPRSVAQQHAFFRAELRCQALELLFSEAAGVPFRVSVDDLEAPPSAADGFAQDVRAAAGRLRSAPPPRAGRLLGALRQAFSGSADG